MVDDGRWRLTMINDSPGIININCPTRNEQQKTTAGWLRVSDHVHSGDPNLEDISTMTFLRSLARAKHVDSLYRYWSSKQHSLSSKLAWLCGKPTVYNWFLHIEHVAFNFQLSLPQGMPRTYLKQREYPWIISKWLTSLLYCTVQSPHSNSHTQAATNERRTTIVAYLIHYLFGTDHSKHHFTKFQLQVLLSITNNPLLVRLNNY